MFLQRWFHVPNPHSCMTKHYHIGPIEFTREALHMSMNMHVFLLFIYVYTREILQVHIKPLKGLYEAKSLI